MANQKQTAKDSRVTQPEINNAMQGLNLQSMNSPSRVTPDEVKAAVGKPPFGYGR